MTSTTPSGGRLGAALADAQVALREVVETCGWVGALSPADRSGALQEAVVLGRMVDAAVLQLMATSSRRDLDAVGAANPVGLLTGAAGYDPAAERLELVSRATGSGDLRQPPMPEVTALHAAGRISTDVFDLAARHRRRPAAVAREPEESGAGDRPRASAATAAGRPTRAVGLVTTAPRLLRRPLRSALLTRACGTAACCRAARSSPGRGRSSTARPPARMLVTALVVGDVRARGGSGGGGRPGPGWNP